MRGGGGGSHKGQGRPVSWARWCRTSRSNPRGQLHRLLLLSRFSRVRLYAAQEMTAHQALPSLGFSRQEHWSGCHCLLHTVC